MSEDKEYVTIEFWTAPDETACHCTGIGWTECKYSRDGHPGNSCPGWYLPAYTKVLKEHLLKEPTNEQPT